MALKLHKPKPAKKTPSTLLAEAMRAEGNKLTDAQREKLSEEFMKLYYGGRAKPAQLVNFERLAFELQSFDVPLPIIATPREIVRKFFH
jgi:hypothetical protein